MKAVNITLLLALLVRHVVCNTEKTIFSAPSPIQLPHDAALDHLHLVSLNDQHPSVRTAIKASFPTIAQPRGTKTWFLLEGLNPGQRYEVRVCWLATQPTSFWLYTHSFSEAMETPELISSLSEYAYMRRDALSAAETHQLGVRRQHMRAKLDAASLLFLEVYAAADFFSPNQTLMENVPPVLVDVILDPYILNVLPSSLMATVGYIVIVACIAWFLSAWISSRLHSLSSFAYSDKNQRDIDSIKKKA